jgi:thiol-disulfide isomerase/thioredoxin
MAAGLPSQEILRDMIKMNIYSVEHIFDTFPWEDDRLLKTPVLYNKFKTFAQQLLPLESEFSIPVVVKVLNESKKNRNMCYALFDYLEHEFGSFKSPYRDELLYIAMLHDILTLPDLEEMRKLHYEYELNLITKNQPGEQAIDFNILLSAGDTTNLYAIDAEILLLYFQNPDCPTCSEFREKMKNMEVLYHALVSEKLKVLTVYFDENEELWRNYLKTRAYNTWMHGWNYDFEISEKHLYDIRAIPTIMILDKNKKILKKDIFPNELEDWLKRNL